MAIIIPQLKPLEKQSKKMRRVMERGMVLLSALAMVIVLAQQEQSLKAGNEIAMNGSAHYSIDLH